MKRMLTVAIVVALSGTVLSAVACGSSKKSSSDATPTSSPVAETPASTTSGTPTTQLDATLLEYAIQLPEAPTTTGDVTFNVTNAGSTTHEMVVLKTDLASADLPSKDDGAANEDAEGVTNLGETGDMAAGESKDFTVDLQAGHYVVICNIVQTTNGETVSHYQKGMYTEFTIAP